MRKSATECNAIEIWPQIRLDLKNKLHLELFTSQYQTYVLLNAQLLQLLGKLPFFFFFRVHKPSTLIPVLALLLK